MATKKTKVTKKKATKSTSRRSPIKPTSKGKKAAPAKDKGTKKATATKEELCVFAIRLLPSERDAIHAAAGPRNATKFVRGLAVAAARGDLDTIKGILASRETGQ